MSEFHRIAPGELADMVAGRAAPLILDVRRSEAFAEHPWKIENAVPLAIDREPAAIPEVDRERRVVVYCL